MTNLLENEKLRELMAASFRKFIEDEIRHFGMMDNSNTSTCSVYH